MNSTGRRIAGVCLFIALWQIASTLRWLDAALFPRPSEVLVALGELGGVRTVVDDLGSTLRRLAYSVFWGAGIAVPIGLVLGIRTRVEEFAGLLIDFFRSLPATAMFPVFMLFFGLGESSKIGVTAFSSGLVILVGTIHAVRQIRPLRIEAAQACGATGATLFVRVILPAAAPGIAIALRTAIGIGLIVVIVTEMFAGTSTGLGWRIFAARESFRVDELYALLIVTGGLGAAISGILQFVENRVVHWAGQ